MRRQSVKITTLVIILSIAAVYFQFFCYYFFDNAWLVLTITFITSLLLAHFFLEASLSYEPGFLQCFFTVSLSFIFSFLIANNRTGGFLVYKGCLPYIVLINWMAPVAYFIVRCLYDRGPRFVGFHSFFIKTSILFGVFYLFVLAVKLFVMPMEAPYALFKNNPAPNLVPFWTTAGQIEDFIYQQTSLVPTLIYIIKAIFLYIPYGFYLRILLRTASILVRSGIILLFPLLVEAAQYLFSIGHCDIDDFMFALLGSLIGILIYNVLNKIFLSRTEYAFLEEKPPYSFYKNIYY